MPMFAILPFTTFRSRTMSGLSLMAAGEIIIELYPNQGAIRFISKFRVTDTINYADLVQFANKINLQTLGVRACGPRRLEELSLITLCTFLVELRLQVL